MGIFSRTRDIIAANMSDLLEKAEDPSKMIRMIIFEMEETLVEVRSSAARTIAEQKEMQRAVRKLDLVQQNWTEKAELALSKDREDLAKAALYERQKATDMIAQMRSEITELDEALASYEDDISKLQSKLNDARVRQNSVLTRIEVAEKKTRMRQLYTGAKVDEAFARFEYMERKADLAEGRAEAALMGSQAKSLEQEIADLETADKIDAELAELKNRISKQEG